jgi:ELWxxDGT repeat protein
MDYGSYPGPFTPLNGKLYFAAGTTDTSSPVGRELWETDGTSAGTVMVGDLLPGSLSSMNYAAPLVNVNGALYFTASTGPLGGNELWRSDGTLAGTAPINFDAAAASPLILGVINNDRLIYSGNSLPTGQELFTLREVSGTTVSSVVVNNGNAQRSRLTSITVNFAASTDVTLFQNPGAVTLTRTSGGPLSTVTIGSGLIVTPGAGNNNSITLTFQNVNSGGVEFSSLADGRWQLAIPSLSYTSPLNGADIRRRYGEINNDLTVDGADLIILGNNFGTSFVALDWNNDNTIDGTDLVQFGNRFGIVI